MIRVYFKFSSLTSRWGTRQKKAWRATW